LCARAPIAHPASLAFFAGSASEEPAPTPKLQSCGDPEAGLPDVHALVASWSFPSLPQIEQFGQVRCASPATRCAAVAHATRQEDAFVFGDAFEGLLAEDEMGTFAELASSIFAAHAPVPAQPLGPVARTRRCKAHDAGAPSATVDWRQVKARCLRLAMQYAMRSERARADATPLRRRADVAREPAHE
jgi:hypothetical protein